MRKQAHQTHKKSKTSSKKKIPIKNMSNKSTKPKITKILQSRWRRPITLAGSFAIIGIAILISTQAATPTANFEGESGSRDGGTLVTDPQASGGAAVQFGSTTTVDLKSKRFFADDASWNRPVSDFGRSTALDSYADRFWNYAGLPAAPGVSNVQFKDYSVPIYDAAEATTTARAYQAIWVQNQSTFSTTGNQIGETIPWNPSWMPGTGNDRIMQIVNYSTGKVYGLWIVGEPAISCDDRNPFGITFFDGPNTKAGYNPNSTNPLHLCMGMLTSSTNLFTVKDGQTIVDRGMGINKLALVTRANEVDSGVIRHALALTITSTMFGAPNCNPDKGLSASGAGVSCGAYLAPATRVEWASNENNRIGNRCEGAPITVDDAARSKTVPEGMRFALDITDAEINAWLATKTTWSTAKKNTARIFAVALRDYGAIVAETGCFGIGIETDGLVNPTSKAVWEENGITDIAGNKNPHGDLLQGLFTQERLYVVNPPN